MCRETERKEERTKEKYEKRRKGRRKRFSTEFFNARRSEMCEEAEMSQLQERELRCIVAIGTRN